jgi:glycerol-3-phosphate dehydrogenase
VVNRLRPPGNGDILVPGGTVSILGTTSVTIDDPDRARPTVAEADENVRQALPMIPSLGYTRFVRAYCGVRPLIRSDAGQGGDGRSVSRGFMLYGHEEAGLSNFCSVSGGKLTTYRLMAEKTADLVCARLGVSAPCRTRTEPLPAAPSCRWTEPGFAPRLWTQRHDADDPLLCECEMVPASAVDGIMDDCGQQFPDPGLQALGKRSRIGKGSCQGAFCGVRVAAHLYDTGHYTSPKGLTRMREFFTERFKGQRPVLWGPQLIQAELAEALHCGLLGLELEGPDTAPAPGAAKDEEARP